MKKIITSVWFLFLYLFPKLSKVGMAPKSEEGFAQADMIQEYANDYIQVHYELELDLWIRSRIVLVLLLHLFQYSFQ